MNLSVIYHKEDNGPLSSPKTKAASQYKKCIGCVSNTSVGHNRSGTKMQNIGYLTDSSRIAAVI